MLGKLKQRPTMASFPPWAAAEQGLHGRPLGAPVISCAGCGAPGQPQMGRKQAGHLLPPPGWPSQARVAASVSKASTACLPPTLGSATPAEVRPALLRSAQASREGTLAHLRSPLPPADPSCSHHLCWRPCFCCPSLCGQRARLTELRTKPGREQCIGY